MADNIRKPARARRLKRVAIVTACVSTVALTAFVIVAFLPKGDGAFTIRIDAPVRNSDSEENNHFRMSKGWNSAESRGQEVSNGMNGDPVDNMVPTTALDVEDYLTTLRNSEKGLYGQQNYEAKMIDMEGNVTDKGYALVYTVYLNNESETDDQNLKYTVYVNSWVRNPDNDIFNYFRVLIQTEVVDSNNIYNYYYGERHNNPKAPYDNALGNDREPISTYETGFGVKIIKSTKDPSNGNDGYCRNFETLISTKQPIVNGVEFKIPAGKTLRFTYVSYFEGEDMDCYGSIPSESYLSLSLHFGL